VLRGIGAAFRLNEHLAVGTAVILEEFVYELWYTRYLTPYVHYIPLAAEGANLSEVLVWTQAHPTEVKAVAQRGRQFYDENLSPPAVGSTFHYFFSRLTQFLSTNDTHAKWLQELGSGGQRNVHVDA